ncbi:HK97-gp10 family putative phage morphogenesis protein [Cytobacillus sp. NCCP-133]|uniref:HK97-gp10 family putative phage morphogenesis protein n=1 Tax=Cytobacillus sp. NCCP-133 TaxID=766848 RepID=UPI0022313181|nr:HK97-gp10 family putative phage morphogenesis protein [Cytobacillus sp. NCCP-133]
MQDFEGLTSDTRKTVSKALEYTAEDIFANIKREAPVDHGRLAGSFQLKKLNDLQFQIYSQVEYIWFVHEGTGIYGPHNTPIKPVTSPVLRFMINGRWISKKEVKGQKGNPFMDRAFDKTETRLQEFIIRAIQETT